MADESLVDRYFPTPHCPQCAYSRNGLADDARCPECAWTPERGTVVLWGLRIIHTKRGVMPWNEDFRPWFLMAFTVWLVITVTSARRLPETWSIQSTGIAAIYVLASAGVFWRGHYEWRRWRCYRNLGASDQMRITHEGVGMRVGPGAVRLTPWTDIQSVRCELRGSVCWFVAKHHAHAFAPLTAPLMIAVPATSDVPSDAWALAEFYRSSGGY